MYSRRQRDDDGLGKFTPETGHDIVEVGGAL
jgi:hypothetical protein